MKIFAYLCFMALSPALATENTVPKAETLSYTLKLNSSAQEERLRARFPGQLLRNLFSASEQIWLKRNHQTAMASTYLFGPVPEAQQSAFLKTMRDEFAGVKIELNAKLEFKQAAVAANLDAADRLKAGQIEPDPLKADQWYLKNTAQPVRIDIDDLRTEALQVRSGEDLNLPVPLHAQKMKQVTVAVLDTGVDLTHPDLRGNIAFKKEECEALTTYLGCLSANFKKAKPLSQADAEQSCIKEVGNIDRDGNGYPMDCAGWSLISSLSSNEKSSLSQVLGTPDMDDVLGHGTHVAGVIAAVKNNGIGISGIAQNVRILPVRVIDSPPISPIRPQSYRTPVEPSDELPSPREQDLKSSRSSVELIARGMLYAIREHVQIINLSLGWPSTISSSLIVQMVKIAEAQGIAVVAAAGNDSTDTLVLPCSISGVICVGSYGPDGKRANYSNRGPGVDLLAPGTSILSTYPLALRARFFTALQGYELMSGTSMSAPMVSGALALLMGEGHGEDESLARMILGARHESSDLGEDLRLDVGQALKIVPRPYLHVRERSPVRLTWDQESGKLVGNFHLKSLWAKASNCRVNFELRPAQDTVTAGALRESVQVTSSVQDCSRSSADLTQSVFFQLQILSHQVPRDFILQANLQYAAEGGQRFAQTVAVNVQIVPAPALIAKLLKSEQREIVGSSVGKEAYARTVQPDDERSKLAWPNYIVLSRLDKSIGLQLLSLESEGRYHYSNSQTVNDLSWQFTAARRYYSTEAGANRIALVFRKRSEISGLTQLRFELYDDHLLKMIRRISYDGSYAPLGEDFRWTSLGGRDALLFMANGKEAPSSNLWHPVLDKNVFRRAYLLDSDSKLSQLTVDPNNPDTRIVDTLPLRAEDTERDENALLIIRGQDYNLSYFIGHLHDGKIIAMKPFTVTPNRNLGFLNASPSLSDTGLNSSTVLSSRTGRGLMRSTVLDRTAYDQLSSSDFRLTPVVHNDGLNRVVGGYRIGQTQSFFDQANWDLQYHEFTASGETRLKTSMNRFSFLPALVSQRNFYPLTVVNRKRTEPGVLMADIGSGFFNLWTLIPERNASGDAVGILRPALLSFEGNENGCSFIETPVWNSEQKKYRMNSFCGNSIRSVPLQLP